MATRIFWNGNSQFPTEHWDNVTKIVVDGVVVYEKQLTFGDLKPGDVFTRGAERWFTKVTFIRPTANEYTDGFAVNQDDYHIWGFLNIDNVEKV